MSSALGHPLAAAVKARQTIDRLVGDEHGDDLSDDGRELEPMARTWAGDDDLVMHWMMIDHEVPVGRIRIQADGALAQLSRGLRKEVLEQIAGTRILLLIDRASNALWIRDLSIMVNGDLHPVAEVGNRVEHAIRGLPERDREIVWRKAFGMRARCKPVLHLALDPKLNLRAVEKLGKPGPEREDEVVGDMLAHGRGDTYCPALDAPAQHGRGGPKAGPVAGCTPAHRADARLGKEHSGARLEERHRASLGSKHREAPAHLG